MIRINQIKLPIEHTPAMLIEKICKQLHIPETDFIEYHIVKQSLDARKKPDLFYVYAVNVTVKNESVVLKKNRDKNIGKISEKKYEIPHLTTKDDKIQVQNEAPVIIGAGPAGIFCAYELVLAGLSPVILERGKKIEERIEDVTRFWETGRLLPNSNVQFGEGGAGTFSDGKLNTLVKDPMGRNRFVLETFVKYGAPEKILYENKPHIGTDILSGVISRMRTDMIQKGAVFHFDTCVTDFKIENGTISAVQINQSEWIKTKHCVLALGHSARDTFRTLQKRNFSMSAKSFAVGFRVEHPQEMINRNQYGDKYYASLPAAPYKVTANLENGRGVYSFCMCPGGYVVNASSEDKRLAVNGMSYSGRNSQNANSAIIVSVTPEDFGGTDALSGVVFQEKLEEKAYTLGDGKIPQQLFGDYCKNQTSTSYGIFESQVKGETQLCNLRGLLPKEAEESFLEGMHCFSRTMKGFDREDAILSGIESRTSSPVRIERDETFESNIKGVFPCGEGAGYAGGIMSAAMDGLKVAEAILERHGYKKWHNTHQ